MKIKDILVLKGFKVNESQATIGTSIKIPAKLANAPVKPTSPKGPDQSKPDGVVFPSKYVKPSGSPASPASPSIAPSVP